MKVNHMNIPEASDRSKAKIIPITFRWPVNQVNQGKIEVIIPTSKDASPLVSPNLSACMALGLTDREIVKVQEASEAAAIKAILIID
jgi:hypothetical protein